MARRISAGVRPGRRLESLRLQARQDEGVDRIGAPFRILDCQQSRQANRLQGPVPGSDLGNRESPVLVGAGRFGPGSALLDPDGQVSDGLVREFLLGRHLQLAGMLDDLEQQALLRLTGKHNPTAVAALEKPDPRIEAQSAVLFFRTVAGLAALDQDRADMLLEELLGSWLGGTGHVELGGQQKSQKRQRRRQPASRLHGVNFWERR